MTFEELKEVCLEFRRLIEGTTGRNLIASISLAEPTPPPDELHFLRLVSWCYAFLIEGSQPVMRFIMNILRASSAKDFKNIDRLINEVVSLRTMQSHNLSLESSSDARHQVRASAWLSSNGGDPPDWGTCCGQLADQVAGAIRTLSTKWRTVVANPEDAADAITKLLLQIDNDWPGHELDKLVEGAASALGLKSFNATKYREKRIKDWRDMAGCFEDRDHARSAVSALIHRELERLFGAVKTAGSGHIEMKGN